MPKSAPGIDQAGVLPYRVGENGLEVLLITRCGKHGRWIVPKGHIEGTHTPQEAAAQEAFEEAGAIGEISAEPLGQWHYRKRGLKFHVDVYAYRVTSLLDAWPEKGQRKRKWLPLERALRRVAEEDLRIIMRLLPTIIPAMAQAAGVTP